MSPSKFEPAAEKITENITDNPEPQSLIDSPTKKTCILHSLTSQNEYSGHTQEILSGSTKVAILQ